MSNPLILSIPEIEAAVDRIVKRRNAIIRDQGPYVAGDIARMEDDLRQLRRLWSEAESDEDLKGVKVVIKPHHPNWLKDVNAGYEG